MWNQKTPLTPKLQHIELQGEKKAHKLLDNSKEINKSDFFKRKSQTIYLFWGLNSRLENSWKFFVKECLFVIRIKGIIWLKMMAFGFVLFSLNAFG